ncbi:monoacylglycerol lipase [Bacillus sp. SA1-12]|uniref:alpha/beta hydrolase n=1 Tax=Bacillus sp. SA1-12 TaxID=1455638 RepID=UPI000626FAD0|nr:alpha/beta fold hydrolase [Bacillus sp. SA1-12]KKI90473.1 monoacylglycerol lipase [Bacillus sp. SA1-12]
MRETYPVIEGAEEFYIKGNKVGLLLSHGFMGTPQSVHFLGEKWSELGYTVYAPRLKGHGTHYKDLEHSTHMDWFSDLEKGYLHLKEHCTTIFIIGQSMGGTLALWLANKYKDIRGLVLINPALTVPNYDQWIGKSSPRYLSESAPDIKSKGIREITYNKVPIQSIHELQTLMGKTPKILPNITNSILCFKSAEDHVVPPQNTDYILVNIASAKKEAVILYHSYHVASMDHDKEKIIMKTHTFIQKNLKEANLIDRGA